ncbi:MAG TPA: nuclear transport factor 2 family protein, partial [Bacteroidota bacterium]|nr:nuclear transport factor 2 family protein [Bacteroidota bacterium]
MKRATGWVLLSMLLPCAVWAQPHPSGEDSAITTTALNYIEGWYEGNAARMEEALHPELAKRMVYTDPKTGRSQLSQMSAMTLVQSTKRGGGSKTPAERQMKEVTILDRFNNAAVVKVVASDWIDYLQVVKFNGQWK